MRGSRAFKAVVAALAASVVLVGCGGGGAGDKAGGKTSEQITLRLGTEDGPERPAGSQIDQFVQQVTKLSGGRIKVEPTWEVTRGQDDWDQKMIGKIKAGEFDLAMVPARAWDAEGVTSLRALSAPMLVTSDQLMARIVQGPLAGQMLAGLDKAGVTGLGLYPDSLRHVFTYDPVRPTLAALDGKMARVPRSETVYELFKALGATPDDFQSNDELENAAIRSGQLVAADSAFELAGTLEFPTTGIGNVTLYAKGNTLVANETAFGKLTTEQQAILRDAAAKTADWAVGATRGDADLAKQFCGNGGKVVLASRAEVAKLERAFEPVYAQIERDAATKAMIGQIRSLGAGVATPVAVTACAPKGSSGATPPPSAETVKFPEGVYRARITEASLLQAGVGEVDAGNHTGTWTLNFKDGVFNGWDTQLEGKADPNEPTCPGSSYTVSGDRVTITLGQGGVGCGNSANQELFNSTWKLEGDKLTFTDVRAAGGVKDPLLGALFGGTPWTRIG
jgi:TRAP-type C4-dicarboxylate transport system substrate-binding protein